MDDEGRRTHEGRRERGGGEGREDGEVCEHVLHCIWNESVLETSVGALRSGKAGYGARRLRNDEDDDDDESVGGSEEKTTVRLCGRAACALFIRGTAQLLLILLYHLDPQYTK